MCLIKAFEFLTPLCHVIVPYVCVSAFPNFIFRSPSTMASISIATPQMRPSGSSKRKKGSIWGSKSKKQRKGILAKLSVPLSGSRTEVKSVDIGQNIAFGNIVTATGQLLNDTSTGADFYNRIGRKVAMKNVRIRGKVIGVNGAAGEDYLRLSLIYDKQYNAGAPQFQQVFQDTANAGAATTNCFSGVNLNNRDRFVVLREFTLAVPSANSIPTVAVFPNSKEYVVDWFVPLKGADVIHSGSALTTIQSGALLLFALSENAQGYSFQYQSRIRFYDP